MLVEMGEQHNHIRVVFLLLPDNITITYINTCTEKKKKKKKKIYIYIYTCIYIYLVKTPGLCMHMINYVHPHNYMCGPQTKSWRVSMEMSHLYILSSVN